MIIVDTSVWVDYFNGKLSEETDSLDTMLGNQEILLGDLILTEILQGFLEDRLFREAQNKLSDLITDLTQQVEKAIKSYTNLYKKV